MRPFPASKAALFGSGRFLRMRSGCLCLCSVLVLGGLPGHAQTLDDLVGSWVSVSSWQMHGEKGALWLDVEAEMLPDGSLRSVSYNYEGGTRRAVAEEILRPDGSARCLRYLDGRVEAEASGSWLLKGSTLTYEYVFPSSGDEETITGKIQRVDRDRWKGSNKSSGGFFSTIDLGKSIVKPGEWNGYASKGNSAGFSVTLFEDGTADFSYTSSDLDISASGNWVTIEDGQLVGGAELRLSVDYIKKDGEIRGEGERLDPIYLIRSGQEAFVVQGATVGAHKLDTSVTLRHTGHRHVKRTEGNR